MTTTSAQARGAVSRRRGRGRWTGRSTAPATEPARSTALATYERWPGDDGFFAGYSRTDTLQPGSLIDRYGLDGGSYVSPAGTPFPQRGLPGDKADDLYSVFEVRRPIEVTGGIAAPWMGSPGGGIQYLLPASVQKLLDDDFLRRVR